MLDLYKSSGGIIPTFAGLGKPPPSPYATDKVG